jgi:hypothetical protein
MEGLSRKRPQDEVGPSMAAQEINTDARKRSRTDRDDHSKPSISDAALLYLTAISAHTGASRHLQQAFVPGWAAVRGSKFDPIPLYPSTDPLVHDSHAARKALDLQLLAVELLDIGLKTGHLSDSERAAFAIEFAIVGLKVRAALRYTDRKGKMKAKVDEERLMEDMQQALALGVGPQLDKADNRSLHASGTLTWSRLGVGWSG